MHPQVEYNKVMNKECPKCIRKFVLAVPELNHESKYCSQLHHYDDKDKIVDTHFLISIKTDHT